MMLGYVRVMMIMGFFIEGAQSTLHKKKDADLVCHACLKTVEQVGFDTTATACIVKLYNYN